MNHIGTQFRFDPVPHHINPNGKKKKWEKFPPQTEPNFPGLCQTKNKVERKDKINKKRNIARPIIY